MIFSANFDDGSCLQFDECGVCGGDGIADGACNCEGEILDAACLLYTSDAADE